jgi:hypothetical protein
MRAELARVALMLGSRAIYTAVNVETDNPMFTGLGGVNMGFSQEEGKSERRSEEYQDFEEACSFLHTHTRLLFLFQSILFFCCSFFAFLYFCLFILNPGNGPL